MLRWLGIVSFVVFAAGATALTLGQHAVSLPVYGSIPAFSLTDEHGGTVRRDDLLGKVTVVDFIFTSCSSACPLLSTEMGRLQKDVTSAHLADKVQLLSVSVDPERDTLERLREFASRYGADPRTWRFVRGDDSTLRAVVVDSMKQDISREVDKGERDGFTILHGTRFVLIDREARLRGFYDANDPASMKQLRDAMAALVAGRATVAR
ncbi:MAG: SCO family protein [Polyangia bacterium]